MGARSTLLIINCFLKLKDEKAKLVELNGLTIASGGYQILLLATHTL